MMLILPKRVWMHTSDREVVEIDRHGNKQAVVKKIYSSWERMPGEQLLYWSFNEFYKEKHVEQPVSA